MKTIYFCHIAGNYARGRVVCLIGFMSVSVAYSFGKCWLGSPPRTLTSPQFGQTGSLRELCGHDSQAIIEWHSLSSSRTAWHLYSFLFFPLTASFPLAFLPFSYHWLFGEFLSCFFPFLLLFFTCYLPFLLLAFLLSIAWHLPFFLACVWSFKLSLLITFFCLPFWLLPSLMLSCWLDAFFVFLPSSFFHPFFPVCLSPLCLSLISLWVFRSALSQLLFI